MGVEGCSDKLRSGEVGEVPGLRLPRACLGDAPVCLFACWYAFGWIPDFTVMNKAAVQVLRGSVSPHPLGRFLVLELLGPRVFAQL